MSKLDRRAFLLSGAASLAGASGCNLAETPSRQPNVFLIIGDDMAYYDAGCYGSQQARTPNIDRLAGQGMRFERAFTGTAMCAPMRQQLYTGLFPVRSGAYPNHSKSREGVRSIPHYFGALDYRVGLWGKKHFGPPENYPFEDLGQSPEDFIDFDQVADFVSRDPEQPYFLTVCSHDSHLPYLSGDQSHFHPAEIELPPYLVDTPKTREFYAAYLAEVENLDSQVGECMRIVDESGQADDTIFIFCSEQGSAFPGGKWTCYEAGLREAWLVRWPGRVAAGATTDAMVQNVDALPTLIEAAGGNPRQNDFDGRSYLDVLEERADTHGQHAFGVHTTRGIVAGSENYPVRSVRDNRYKLIWNLNYATKFHNIVTEGADESDYWAEWVTAAETDPHAARMVARYQRRPEYEFYDLDEDPWELDNRIGDPAHAKRVVMLRETLEAWMDQQGDRGIETEAEALDHQLPRRNRGRETR